MLTIGGLKGGVGKSQLVTQLGAAAAANGARVLVVDADPQATTTEVLGVDPEADQLPSIADVVQAVREQQDVDVRDAIVTIDRWGIDLLPSELRLMRTELSRTPGDELILTGLLDPLDADYDLILADPPGYLGVMSANVLRASRGVVAVTTPTRGAMSALALYLDVIGQLRRTGSAGLEVVGVVANLVADHERDPRLRMDELREWVATDGAPPLLEPTIPRRAVIAEAMGEGLPLVDAPGLRTSDVAPLFERLAARIVELDN